MIIYSLLFECCYSINNNGREERRIRRKKCDLVHNITEMIIHLSFCFLMYVYLKDCLWTIISSTSPPRFCFVRSCCFFIIRQRNKKLNIYCLVYDPSIQKKRLAETFFGKFFFFSRFYFDRIIICKLCNNIEKIKDANMCQSNEQINEYISIIMTFERFLSHWLGIAKDMIDYHSLFFLFSSFLFGIPRIASVARLKTFYSTMHMYNARAAQAH
jgi:hypothetical protein